MKKQCKVCKLLHDVIKSLIEDDTPTEKKEETKETAKLSKDETVTGKEVTKEETKETDKAVSSKGIH